MNLVTLIFQYKYLQNAYIMGILIGVLAPILGSYVVIKRLGLIVDGVSHITLAGVSFGMFFNKFSDGKINPMYVGVCFSLIGSIFIEKISSALKILKK